MKYPLSTIVLTSVLTSFLVTTSDSTASPIMDVQRNMANIRFFTLTKADRERAKASAVRAVTTDRGVIKSVKSHRCKYVAVPIKAKNSQTGKSEDCIVKVQVKEKADGTIEATKADDTAYPTIKMKSGEVVTVGGELAVYAPVFDQP